MSVRSLAFGFVLMTVFVIITNGAYLSHNEANEYDMVSGIKVYRVDRECALLGGLCVHMNDCLEPSTRTGLCPSNSYRGVECCYELPLRSAPCHQHLGACMPSCNVQLSRPGTDCDDGEICCVLV